VTVTSLAFGGVTLTDSCRTAAYDSVAAYTAAVAADAYVPSPSLIGRSDCACTDCPTPAPSLWPTQPGKLAPWVAADRPDSAELWDVRSSVWERQTAITDSGEPCGPTSWRWEVELVGSPAGRRHGVTWLTQRLHAAAGCRAGSCTDCGAHTLAVAEDCGPVRTVRDARAVVVRELFEDVGPCTSRVEVLFEAADGRMWDAPEVVASYPAAAWGAAECNPLHPLLIDCDCTPDPCAPTAVRWDSIQPGCIVVPGEGDESILTRVIQSPDASAFYDLTRAGLRAPFRRVDVYDTTGGTVRAAPSGVVWSLAGVPGGPANTTVVAVIDADGVSCQFRLGLLAVFCRTPIVDRPAFDSTSTLVRAAAAGVLTQPLPAADTSAPPDSSRVAVPWIDADLTTIQYANLPDIEVTPFIPGDPLADPPVPDIPATYRSAMAAGSVDIFNVTPEPTNPGGAVSATYWAKAVNTDRDNDITDATIRVWAPHASDPSSATFTATASGGASAGTPGLFGAMNGRYWNIGAVNIPVGGSIFIVTSIPILRTDTSPGTATIEMFRSDPSSSLAGSVSDSANTAPQLVWPEGGIFAQLDPAASILAPGGTMTGNVWQVVVAETLQTDGADSHAHTVLGIVRLWRPAEVVSWTITPTTFGGASVISTTDQGRYVDIVVSMPGIVTPSGGAFISFDISNVTRDNGDGDVSALHVAFLGDGGGGSDSAPGPVVPVVQPRRTSPPTSTPRCRATCPASPAVPRSPMTCGQCSSRRTGRPASPAECCGSTCRRACRRGRGRSTPSGS
jgi:hypothetical protein